jgi:chromate transport protein ChrA
LLRLWYVIGVAGGSIAFLGLLQKATGAQMIFWQPPLARLDLRVSTFFATYYYHGNAGAFLNLVWPLTAGLVIRAFSSRRRSGMRAVWISLFIVTIAGVLANTSRMSQVLALVLVFVICAQFRLALLRKLSASEKGIALADGEPTDFHGCPVARFPCGNGRCARRAALRIRAGNISRCVSNLQHRIG